MDEMNITSFSSSRPQTFFLHGDGKCCFHTVFYSVLCFSLNLFDQSKFHFHRGRT